MERTAPLLGLGGLGSVGNGPDFQKGDPLLPYCEKPCQKRLPRLKAVFSHCLYKRVLVWTVVSLVLILFGSHSTSFSLSHVVDYARSKVSNLQNTPENTSNERQGADEDTSGDMAITKISDGSQKPPVEVQVDQLDQEEDEKERQEFDKEADEKPWLRFPHLKGYFHGLKTLVKASELVPEYPRAAAPLPALTINKGRLRKPAVYKPYSTAGGDVKTCYLDTNKKMPAPDVYAYQAVPQHMPDAALGSYEIFGMRDDVCFDRFGRFGPYGLGYGKEEGGSGVGQDTENSDSEFIWATSGKINYTKVDWGQAQDDCSHANKHRLVGPDAESKQSPKSAGDGKGKGNKSRQAVLVRCYTGFHWTDLAVVNLRALITELSLKSGGEYTIHILLHVLDNDEPIWADDDVAQRILDSHIPAEFQSLVTLWSEAQMELVYPGDFQDTYDNPSNGAIHSVYRSAHFPLQVFASRHPEYEYFWNWEMDMRHLGNYFELLDRIGRWADNQSRPLLWERSERYYIPSYHGTWDNFTKTVQADHTQSGRQAIFGPVDYEDRKPLDWEERGESGLPDCGSAGHEPSSQCGVGEGADLITFNPIFDIANSGWVFSNDLVGYKNPSYEDPPNPPRRASIITAGRLSRRLLMSMHQEVWRHHRTMFSEMFPATVALHHGLKAVYAPHPIFMDRAWTPAGSSLDAVFNAGRDHSTSGPNSPFFMWNEHNHKGSSFYYHSEFAGLLWRRWLGYAQMGGERGTTLGGGYDDESRPDSTGRMCLRSMLLHPIKTEEPDA